MKNYYEVLGVPTDATSDDIKKAHRRISAKTYSRTGKADEGDTARFIEANQAYKVLYNSDTRKAYDLENFTVISKVTEVSTDPKPASEKTIKTKEQEISEVEDDDTFISRFIIIVLVIVVLSILFSGHQKKETLLKQIQMPTAQEIAK